MTCAAAGNSLPSRGRARRGARSLSKNGRSAAKALRSSCLMRLRRVAARFFIPVDLESQPGKCDSVETADKRDRPTPARAHGNINDSAVRFRPQQREDHLPPLHLTWGRLVRKQVDAAPNIQIYKICL